MNTLSLPLGISIITLAALTACGGGGGDATAPAAGGNTGGSTGGGTTTTIVDANGTLLTSSSTSTYASGSMGQEVYDALNAARLASGVGALMQSTSLDVAATAHGSYLTSVLSNANMTPAQQAEFSLHQEFTDLVPANLFYASMPQDRAVKSGAIAATGVSSEGVTSGWKLVNNQVVVDGASCAAGLLGTVYHADTALSPYTHVAVSQFTNVIGELGCVVDYTRTSGYGQVRPAGAVVANPAPNATVSGTFFIDTESPRPAASLIPAATAGTPILVSVYNADYINANGAAAPTVTKFEVRNAGGSLIDAVILGSTDMTGANVNADGFLSAGTAVLVPKAPLAGGVYSVSFAGTIKGAAVTKAWSFTAQ